MALKITGLDKFSRQIEDAQKALKGLDGDLGAVSFDPNDPASIEAAIRQIELLIDQRLRGYASNPFIAPLAESMKKSYREGIIKRAAAARLKDSEK